LPLRLPRDDRGSILQMLTLASDLQALMLVPETEARDVA
jgi:hypothetical protein